MVTRRSIYLMYKTKKTKSVIYFAESLLPVLLLYVSFAFIGIVNNKHIYFVCLLFVFLFMSHPTKMNAWPKTTMFKTWQLYQAYGNLHHTHSNNLLEPSFIIHFTSPFACKYGASHSLPLLSAKREERRLRFAARNSLRVSHVENERRLYSQATFARLSRK